MLKESSAKWRGLPSVFKAKPALRPPDPVNELVGAAGDFAWMPALTFIGLVVPLFQQVLCPILDSGLPLPVLGACCLCTLATPSVVARPVRQHGGPPVPALAALPGHSLVAASRHCLWRPGSIGLAVPFSCQLWVGVGHTVAGAHSVAALVGAARPAGAALHGGLPSVGPP